MADGQEKVMETLSGNEPADRGQPAGEGYRAAMTAPAGGGEAVVAEQGQVAAGVVPERKEQQAAAEPVPAVDAGKLRELVLRAHPEAIPELVQGETLEELEASARLATEVYRRIAESVRETVAREAAASVPAGQPGRQAYPLNIESLSPAAKIAEGLRRVRGG